MYALIYLSLLLAAAPAVVTSAPTARLEPLTIESAKGEQVFSVEVVRKEKERNRGLMFRHSMAPDHGMLFDYDPPQKIAFWMKNTYIPLDIIFVDAAGRIINIAQNTTPFSLERLQSAAEARGVLEINGGLSAKLGIKAGDKVRHAIFDPVQ
jgi:uncharacterized membrane protein (UPF0127 family)